MPRSCWRRTTSVTAAGSCCVSARSSFASHAAIKASGRGRLPAWLVWMWSELAFMILPVAVILPDLQGGLTGPSSKESRCFRCYLQEIYSGGSSSTAGILDFRQPGEQKNGGIGSPFGAPRQDKHVGKRDLITGIAVYVNTIFSIYLEMTTRLPG